MCIIMYYINLVIPITIITVFDIINCLEPPIRLPRPRHDVRVRNNHTLPENNRHLLKSLRFTQHSTALNGDHCMTDCIEEYCLTVNETIEKCNVVNERNDFVYYTSNYNNGPKVCHSQCTKGTKSYWWCYIDEEWNWDYCNPRIYNVMTVKHFGSTMSHYGYSLPCKDECTTHGKDYNWCYLLNDSWDYCDPDDPIYYQYVLQTANADSPCVGLCEKHGENYLWCYTDSYLNWDYCAQYANSFKCESCIEDKKLSLRVGTVRDYIAEMENNSSNTKISLNNPNTAIYSYTYRQLANGTRLPLVVRARITSSDIRASNSRRSNSISSDAKRNCKEMGMVKNHFDGNNDVFGHLVSYKNGGSSEFFNIVPQPTSLNIGKMTGATIAPSIWSASERIITNFVRDIGGVVEMHIGIYYADNSTRPVEIGIYERHLGPSHSFHCEYIYSNDPDDPYC